MTSLFVARKPCTRCGAKISWDVKVRKELNTNLPLNPDGTIHDTVYCANATTSTDTEEVKQGRITAIEKAHDENMQASENLRQTIASLIDQLRTIDSTLNMLNVIIKTYLQSVLEQQNTKENSI